MLSKKTLTYRDKENIDSEDATYVEVFFNSRLGLKYTNRESAIANWYNVLAELK